MLTRFRIKNDFRLAVRMLSDSKSSGDNSEIPADKGKTQDSEQKTDTNTEKIQTLLKSMLTKPKIDENEYRQKFATAPDVRKAKLETDKVEVKIEKIEESLTKASREVAEAIGGDVKQTEAELLAKVLGKIDQSSTNISDLLIGMKVDHSKERDDLVTSVNRGQQVKHLVKKTKEEIQKTRFTQRKTQHHKERSLPQATTVNIFSGKPLGIFKAKGNNYGTTLEIWESLKQRELNLATSQAPANYFQKMILWTEQGKVWKFPIDNEHGLEEEQSVPFTDHVFIDAHLEDWCPKKGPVRHFMELVCVGLSKNPFYTAKEKKDHIMWYKEYFESKKDLLAEVGAWGNESTEATN